MVFLLWNTNVTLEIQYLGLFYMNVNYEFYMKVNGDWVSQAPKRQKAPFNCVVFHVDERFA